MAHQAIWLIPDVSTELFFLALALCTLLGFYAFSKNILDARASILASLVGLLLILFSDMFWFFILLIFLSLSYLVTVWRYDHKRDTGTSEGHKGERGVKNVMANGLIPLIIAVFNQPIDSISDGMAGFLFVTAIAIATADTFASEIGIMAKEPRMITSPFEKVEPGVDGGVSMLGNISAFLGALLIAIFGMIFVSDLLIEWGPHATEAGILSIGAISIMGFLGCQIDSLLGATLQRSGLLTNNTVNFTTILIGVLLSVPVFLLIW